MGESGIQADAAYGALMPIGQWARHRGVSAATAHEYCRRGMPHHRRDGRGKHIDPAEADQWISANVASWRPAGGNKGGGRPRKGAEPSAKAIAQRPGIVAAAGRLADSMTDEDRREFLGTFGEVGPDGRVSLRLDRLMRINGAKVIQLKYALESMAKKVELDRAEGRLVEADHVRRALGQKIAALEIALQQAVRTAAARIKSIAGLSASQADEARRVMEEQVDQALVRLRGHDDEDG